MCLTRSPTCRLLIRLASAFSSEVIISRSFSAVESFGGGAVAGSLACLVAGAEAEGVDVPLAGADGDDEAVARALAPGRATTALGTVSPALGVVLEAVLGGAGDGGSLGVMGLDGVAVSDTTGGGICDTDSGTTPPDVLTGVCGVDMPRLPSDTASVGVLTVAGVAGVVDTSEVAGRAPIPSTGPLPLAQALGSFVVSPPTAPLPRSAFVAVARDGFVWSTDSGPPATVATMGATASAATLTVGSLRTGVDAVEFVGETAGPVSRCSPVDASRDVRPGVVATLSTRVT